MPFCAEISLLAFLATQLPTYTIQTVAGTDDVGDGGYATAAILSQAEGIAVDGRGNIYVADADDNRIRKITPDGRIQTVAGTGVSGFGGDGGPAKLAQLNRPYGIAVDGAGTLYIADLGNGAARRVTLDGTISTIHLSRGSAQAIAPRNIAVDTDGTLYVSDFGSHQVYRISAGGVVTVFAGTGKAGAAGDGGPAALAQLNSPAGIALDAAGTLYIADSGNNRIRKVFRGSISTLMNVEAPTGLSVASSGTLYIAAARYLGTTFSAMGSGGAKDVAVDGSGNVYFSTGPLVQRITRSGIITSIAGTGAARYYGGDGGPAASARLHGPAALLDDGAGGWYVADTGNHRIRKIAVSGSITTVAGTGEPGSNGDGGPALLAQLNSPRGLAFDAARNLLIADSANGRIRKLTPGGTITTVVDQLNDPEAIAVDASGALYIAETGRGRVLKLSAPGTVSTVVLTQSPNALAFDRTGNLLIAVSTGVVKLTEAGVLVTIADGLNAPRGLAVTATGDVIIAEAGGHRVWQAGASGTLNVLAGTGTAGFTGDGGAANAAQLSSPSGVAIDSAGIVWIADSGNHRIRTLTSSGPAFDPIVALTVVNGASLKAGPIAPGEIITIYGGGFDPNTLQVAFDGKPASVFFANSTQINTLAPFDLAPNTTTAIDISLDGTSIAGVSAQVASAAPGIFTIGGGAGQAAATNEDGTLNTPSNAAARGSIVTLYATGGGQNLSAVTMTIGNVPAELLYAGPSPGFPGLMQINARVPVALLQTGSLPVLLSVGNAESQPGVTIATR